MDAIVIYFREVNWGDMWDYFVSPTLLMFTAMAVLGLIIFCVELTVVGPFRDDASGFGYDAARRVHLPSAVQYLLVGAAALFVLYARMPERFARGFLWAEDAPIFIGQAYSSGLKSLFIPYAGYLHIVPRTLVYLYSLVVPLSLTPYVFVWTAGILSAAICTGLYRVASRDMHWILATFFALTPTLIPHSGEVWLSLTNLQWLCAPLLLALLWDCAVRPGSDIWRPVVIGLLSLTGPFSVTFAPASLVALLVLRKQPRRFALPFLVSLACVCVQLVMIKVGPPNHVRQYPAIEYLHIHWGQEFFRYFVLDSVIPSEAAAALGGALYPVAFAVFGLIAIAPLFVRGKWKIAVSALLCIAMGLWAIGVVRSDDITQPILWSGFGARFTYIPLILISWALLYVIAKSPMQVARGVSAIVLAFIIARGMVALSVPWMPYAITPQADGSVYVLGAPGEPFHTIVRP